jgi:hypothetical protein
MEMKIAAEPDIVLINADARVRHANPLEAANPDDGPNRPG